MATVTMCKKLFVKTNYLSLAKRRGKQLTFPEVEKGKIFWFDDINKNVKYFGNEVEMTTIFKMYIIFDKPILQMSTNHWESSL